MLHKVNKKARARKAAPNFSLHFKDLSDGDNVNSSTENGEFPLGGSSATVLQPTITAPDVESSVAQAPKPPQLPSAMDPLNLLAEGPDGREEKMVKNLSQDGAPAIVKSGEVPPSPRLANKGMKLVSDKENVAVHPLLKNSESESDSSDEEKNQVGTPQRSQMNPLSTPVNPQQPHQVIKPRLSLDSVFYGSGSPVSNPEAYSKGILSNAIINSKAKSKLLFSALKKNIQQYAGTNINFQGRPPSLEPAEMKTSTIPGGGGMILEADESFTDLSSFTDDHFGEVKPQEHPTPSAQEDPENKDDNFLRKRSSSENNSIFSLMSGNVENKVLTHARKLSDAAQRSIFSMSFSDLKAERKKSLTDSVSVSSLDNSNQPIEIDKLPNQTKLPSAEPKIPKLKASKAASLETFPLIFETIYVLWFCVFLYFITPVPFYIHICVCSFLFGCIFMILFLCMFSSRKKQLDVLVPPYTTMKNIPNSIPKSLYDADQPLKGWMNKIEDYDVDLYHINATASVYVTLEKSTLRLQTPRRNISRRAVHGEGNIPVTNVIHQKIYDMNNASVYLVPFGLVKKRVWNKKYPICIEFGSEDPGMPVSEKLFLFGRTSRQKQEWFYRFQRTIITSQLKKNDEFHDAVQNLGDEDKLEEDNSHRDGKMVKSYYDSNRNLFNPDSTYHDYFTSMCRLLPDPAVYTVVQTGSKKKEEDTVSLSGESIQFSSGHAEVVSSQPKVTLTQPGPGEPGLEVAWFNVFVGRIMFDFLRQSRWADWLSSKIQKKLDKIKLPYFMNGLKLEDIDLGTAVPLVQCISLPSLDSQGIWFDMEITYSGSIQMTLETKMVLTKLGKTDTVVSMKRKAMDGNSAVLNSDEEDSGESSEDDESTVTKFVRQVSSSTSLINSQLQIKSKGQPSGVESAQSSSSPANPQEKRWVRIVDSITKSKYFQKAAESNYIRKKLETVSNTPLILNVELNQCQGRLGINIPPPPSDRIWYGFRESPHMVLRAHPKLGERAVTATLVVDWIEKKLLQEFDKILLLPNMDDIPIPLMFNNLSDMQQS